MSLNVFFQTHLTTMYFAPGNVFFFKSLKHNYCFRSFWDNFLRVKISGPPVYPVRVRIRISWRHHCPVVDRYLFPVTVCFWSTLNHAQTAITSILQINACKLSHSFSTCLPSLTRTQQTRFCSYFGFYSHNIT